MWSAMADGDVDAGRRGVGISLDDYSYNSRYLSDESVSLIPKTKKSPKCDE